MARITYDSTTVRPVTFTDRSVRAKSGLAVVSPLLLLMIWEAASRTGALDDRFFSAPSHILAALWDMALSGELWTHVSASMSRLLIGFAIGAVPGLVLGLMMGVSPIVRMALQGTVDALFPIPKIAVLPLMLMIFGLGESSKYATIAIGVFFPILINTMAGVVNIPRIYAQVGHNYGASRFQIYRTIALPGSLPTIFAGLKLATGIAYVLIVAAEFVGAREGIGYMIWNSWQVFRIEDLFIGLLLISMLGVLTAKLLRVAEARVVPWQA